MMDSTGNAKKMTEIQLIQLCVTPNLPPRWLTPFSLACGHKATRLRDIQPILIELQDDDLRRKKYTDKKAEKKKVKDGKKGNEEPKNNGRKTKDNSTNKNDSKSFKNPWSIPGHDWYDCENNHKSKKIKGTPIKLEKKNKGGSATPAKEDLKTTEEELKAISFDTPMSNAEMEEYLKVDVAEDAIESEELLMSIPTKKRQQSTCDNYLSGIRRWRGIIKSNRPLFTHNNYLQIVKVYYQTVESEIWLLYYILQHSNFWH